MACQIFRYFDEFYKPAVYHFIVSVICAALFALGLEFSRGSDGNIVDYFVSAMVFSSIHFLLTVNALVLFCLTIKYSRSSSVFGSLSGRMGFDIAHFLYTIGNLISFLWSIVGAAISSTGICKGSESKCSYTVNHGINRALAIVITVVHLLNLPPTYFILTTSREPTRTAVGGSKRSGRAITPQPQKQPESDNKKDMRKKVNTDDKEGRPAHAIKTPSVNLEEKRMLHLKHNSYCDNSLIGRRVHQGSEVRNDFPSNETKPLPKKNHYYDDSLIGRRVHQDSEVRNDFPPNGQDSEVRNDFPPNDIKPLPKKNRKLRLSTVGNVIVQINKFADKKDETAALKLASSSSCSTSSSEDKRQDIIYRNPERLPPPSYNDVISADADTNPYWLPSLPESYLETQRLPANMYSGSSFPDTDLVVVQPSKH